MASIITIAGEKLFAAKAQANEQLDIDTFIFANVPGQDATAPISREEGFPSNYIVHQQIVQQVGRINDNVVVYSTVLDSVTGPFEFNWVGLYSSINDTLVAINHIPTTPKTVTADGVAGNTLNRNFGIEYSGIADLTGIDVAPETWQLDFTARLQGMDKLTQQLASDMNGKDWFIGDGFKVEPRETVNTFRILPGVGYVSGLRVELENEHIFNVESYPKFVYVDGWFEGNANSTWSPSLMFTVSGTEIDDYTDAAGIKHYVNKLAEVTAFDTVEDLRADSESADKNWVEGNFNKVFPSVSALKSSDLKAGMLVKTIAYNAGWAAESNRPVGGGIYFIANETDVPAPDGLLDFYLENGLIAVLEKGESLNVYQAGANGKRTADDYPVIQHVLDYSESNNIKVVVVPDGKFNLSKTLQIPRSTTLKGSGCETWTDNSGTIFYIEHDGVGIMLGREGMPSTYRNRGMDIASFKVIGKSMLGCGVSTPRTSIESSRPSAYNWSARRIVVKQSLIGFQFDSTWHVECAQCVALDCDTGFRFQGIGGTSSNFNGLLAYSVRKGFEFLGNGWTYSSWNSCGVDGCEIALSLKGGSFRGSSFRNFGFENTSRIGIYVDHPQAIGVFDGVTIGLHNNPLVTFFVINSAEIVKFNDIRCTSGVLNDCKFISINQLGSFGRVVFDNLSLYSTGNGQIGDIFDKRVMLRDSNVNGIEFTHAVGGLDGKDSSSVKYSSIDQNRDNLSVIATHLLAKSDNDEFDRILGGKPVFDTSNIPDYETIKITNAGSSQISFRTEDFEEGTGIIRDPLLSATTSITIEKGGDYVVFQKRPDGKLYEIDKKVF